MSDHGDPQLPKPRRRRVWPWVLIGFVVVLVVVLVAAVEVFGRSAAQAAIAQQVRSALDVPASTPVEVDLGSGLLAWQLLGGSIDAVDIDVDDLELGPLVGDLSVAARGIPLDQDAPVADLKVTYLVPEAALGAISERLSGVTIQSVSLEGPEIVAAGEVSVLALTLPLGLGLTPGAADGAVTFRPTSIRIGDNTFDAAGLANDPFWGGVARAVTQTQSVCIADQLPAAFTLSEVVVAGDALRVALDGSGQALGGSGFRTKGTCPA